MNIGVCVKLVPPSDVRVSISGDGNSVDKGVYSKLSLNPYDDYALEEAVSLKEAGHAEKVIVFSVDSRPKIDSELRMALAKGGDEVILINDEQLADADAFSVAQALVAAAKSENVGLIMCGKESIDTQSAQIPPMIAELMGWSLATAVTTEARFRMYNEIAIDTGTGNVHPGRSILQLRFWVVIMPA